MSNNKSNLKTNFKLTSSKTTFFFCSLIVCFLGNDCLDMRVPKSVSWPGTTYSNKPSFCIGRQTLPLQRFLVSFLPVETWLQNDCFHRPKPWFQCIVFLPANSRFFQRGWCRVAELIIPPGLDTFVSQTRNSSFETLVSRLFPNLSCKHLVSLPETNLFQPKQPLFWQPGTSVSPSKMCVFPAETHRFHQR
jgi:hypothetical protein